ncbi:HYC_CC_PP family protein [Pedobacter sp. AW1-32]|uniref:HYC_CC_PP family protein n=1 Tax=Pedobacter sp. AW1-32 TaxID=3383026 RepID=UPI003FEFDCAB
MKLRQKIALALAVFYTVSVIGVALSLHFCGGKLENVKLFSNEVTCKFCKDIPAQKKDDGCCKNTKVSLKVKDSHQSEAQIKLPKLFSMQLFFQLPSFSFFQNIGSDFSSKILNKAPPISPKVAIHIFNCIFRN